MPSPTPPPGPGSPGSRCFPSAAGVGRPASRWPSAGSWRSTSAGGQVEVTTTEDEQEAAELAAQLDAWHSAAQLPAGPVRTCFRLVEPELGEEAAGLGAAKNSADASGSGGTPDEVPGDWRVEFALQSTDDPSLMMPAADVWAGASTAGLAAGIKHPEEELLAGLGRAARLFPKLDRALRSPAPAEVTLDTEEAFGFLRQAAPLLSGAGFGVLLPDWVRRSRLGLKLTTRSRRASNGSVTDPKFGLSDLVDFRYDLAVGDQELDPGELAELARLKVPLVRLRGQWVELDDRHLRAALRFLERSQSGTMRASDALLAGLHGADDDLPLVEVDADGWLGDLLSGRADRRLEPVKTPAGFDGELRPYQERGLAWLSFLGRLGLGCVLADDMGLGKTAETLCLVMNDVETRSPAPGQAARPAPTLVVCPMSRGRQLAAGGGQVHPGAEGARAPRRGPAPRRRARPRADRHRPGRSPATALRPGTGRSSPGSGGRGWCATRRRTSRTTRPGRLRRSAACRPGPGSRSPAPRWRTGSATCGRSWSSPAPACSGRAEKFRQRYAIPIERAADEEATARLRRITGPFILRRLKTDKSIISDLPDKLEMKVWCNLTAEQASLYEATVTDMLARIEAAEEGIERRGLVLATMAKLKQVCNHPAHLLGDGSRLPGRSGKLARLEEICDEVIAEGDKALCFTQYAEFGSMLQPYLAARLGCPVLYLHGGTPKKQRDAMVARFQ